MSVNKVILVGNLGDDPEIRYTANGDAIVSLSIATSETFKDKEGNKKTNTEWHRVILFGQLAEIANKWLKKGSMVYIEGKIKKRKWKDQQGNDQYIYEIIADTLRMLGSSKHADNQNSSIENNKTNNNPNLNNEYSREAVSTKNDIPATSPAFDDDDIPF